MAHAREEFILGFVQLVDFLTLIIRTLISVFQDHYFKSYQDTYEQDDNDKG